MKVDDDRYKLRLIKRFFILNMLQQPSCFININKTAKKNSTNIKQENKYQNNSSTEFTPPIQEAINENDSESMIPICDKLSMAKFLVALKLLQRPYYNKNINKTFKNSPINIKHENKATPNMLSLFKSLKNKLNANFMLFVQQITFEYDSEAIKKKDNINTTNDAIYETCENGNDDYSESLTPTPPIIIEAEDIIDIPTE